MRTKERELMLIDYIPSHQNEAVVAFWNFTEEWGRQAYQEVNSILCGESYTRDMHRGLLNCL